MNNIARKKLIPATLVLSCIMLQGCPLFRSAGDSVEAVGEGAAHTVESAGDGIGHAVGETGRAVSRGVDEVTQ